MYGLFHLRTARLVSFIGLVDCSPSGAADIATIFWDVDAITASLWDVFTIVAFI
jgi:hypothetical protein